MIRAAALLAALLLPPLALGDGGQLPMKLDYAEGTVMKSASAQRIDASNNAAAKGKLEEARTLYRQAREAQNNGDFAQAETLVNNALRSMTAAAQLAPDPGNLHKQQKNRHAELLRQAEDYLSWGADYQARANSGDQPAEPETRLDPQQVAQEIAHAKALAADGKLEQANELLGNVLAVVVTKTSKSIGSRTFTYDLNFATPLDEYRHEMGRNLDFERLIAVAIAQHQPSAGMRTLIDKFVERGVRLRHEATALHDEKNFEGAVTRLQESTQEFERALRTAGVR